MGSDNAVSPTPPGGHTFFAPAGREPPEELRRKTLLLENARLLRATLDAMPTIVLVLNGCRQIVAANAALARALGIAVDRVIGERPGEVLRCVHAKTGPDGCGTSESCTFCGAVNAVLACRRKGEQVRGEVRLLREAPGGDAAMDVRITATPVRVEGEQFVVAALEDISHQKRLGVLARIFFHDVMNTVVAMKNFVRLIARKSAKERHDAGDLDCLGELTDQLAEEIQSQRDLTLAEAGDLEVDPQPVRTAEFLQRLCDVYASQEIAAGRRIAVTETADGELTTDVRLLARVLGNMLRNALEATPSGGVVTVRSEVHSDRVVFQVHNDAVMPNNVQMQVFHRSFSTKGVLGRGIGTHSMKLLGERYLHGQVGFTSQTPQGTTFWIELPSRWPQNGSAAR